MFIRCASATVIGIDALAVTAEVHKGGGLPGIHLVGLARGALRESLPRIKSALAESLLTLTRERTVVNLVPAELPKSGSALDLALAIGLLAADDKVRAEALEGRMFYGELSLSGALLPVNGAIMVADLARRRGDHELIVPLANAEEACLIPGPRIIAVASLAEVVAHLRGESSIAPYSPKVVPLARHHGPCLSEVFGQARAKRALEIAAAGGHNMLMIGPPGSGKTMLARRLPSILPPLDADERIEVLRIQSLIGEVDVGSSTRPFRAPHHTASDVALCGGGNGPKPGEISLAHRGVLFLDELPEFSRRALEALREPLEEGRIHVSRAAVAMTFPARCLLVAAMNPCPCGNYRDGLAAGSGAGAKLCLCGFDAVQRYRGRVSGPLLDRIDLHVTVDAVPYGAMKRGDTETSERVRERVIAARRVQRERAGTLNAAMSERQIAEHVRLDEESTRLVERALDRYGLSARAIARVLKIARTIADLAGALDVGIGHVSEAIGLRVLDREPPDEALAA